MKRKRVPAQVFVFPSVEMARRFESARVWRGSQATMVKRKGKMVALFYKASLTPGGRSWMADRMARNVALAREFGARVHTSSAARSVDRRPSREFLEFNRKVRGAAMRLGWSVVPNEPVIPVGNSRFHVVVYDSRTKTGRKVVTIHIPRHHYAD